MKNIYIFDEYISSKKNGIGTYLQELLYCLKSPEYCINLIVFNVDAKEFYIIEENNTKKYFFPVMEGHFLHHVQVIDKFLRLYIQDDPDNIFFLNHSPCNDLIKSLKKIFPFSKIVFTIHDFSWTMPLMGNLKKFRHLIKNTTTYTDKTQNTEENFINYYQSEKEMYELVDRTVCLSKDTYTVLRTLYKLNSEKITLIPNGLQKPKNMTERKNVGEIRDLLNIKRDEKILISIGRPTKQKGIFVLVEAMKLILKTNRNVRLVIIGDANEQSLRELISAKSSSVLSITFTGQLDRSNIYKWLSIANIGVIPSYYEQCSFVGIEMMMFGLPIVTSNGVGIRNMFQNEINCLVAKIGNRNRPKEYSRNLAEAITKLLDSPDLCNRLSAGALKTFEERYSINHMKMNYRKLIESL